MLILLVCIAQYVPLIFFTVVDEMHTNSTTKSLPLSIWSSSRVNACPHGL